ncbi:hypothetical protein OHA72_50945 [Dactylosporangium sp. NBC_01737]|uniref:hypothetical protein n=1 Tax=Dactylosporangium sp. NBC_01737 TaxID=2975959 RepID=UPI002E10FF41|nr:hypothetical protein OHA72_50945 [Dactylosporangium sp. NBC_01737]
MTSLLLAAAARTSAALHATADAWTRAFLLAVDAARFGVAVGRSQVRWSTGVQATTRLRVTLCGHERALSTVVSTTDAAGRPVAVTGGLAEATVRVWDLATGTQTAVLRPSEEDAWALAATVLHDRPTVVTGSFNGVIQTWDVTGGAPTGRVDAGEGDLVCSLAAAWVDGRPVVASTMYTNDGDPDTYCEWPEITVSDLATGRPLHVIDTDHTGAIHVATAVLDGNPVVVSGGSTGRSLRVWDLATGAATGPAFAGHTGGSAAVTTTVLAGRPAVVAAGHDGTVRRWDLATGAPIGEPLTGFMAVHLAALDLAGRPAVVAASADAVCAWDAVTGAVVVPPFVARGVGALAVSVVEGVPVAVTAMRDTTVRIWDLTPDPGADQQTGGSVARPGRAGALPASAKGHRRVVAAIATATVAGPDGAASDGVASGEAVSGGDVAAAGRAGGRQFAVSVGQDRTVHQWDLAARTVDAAHLGELPVDVTDVAAYVADGRVRFVGVGGTDVWCWEAGSAPGLLASVAGRRLWSVATTVLDGRPVAVVVGNDGAWGGELRVVALPTGDHPPTGAGSADLGSGGVGAGGVGFGGQAGEIGRSGQVGDAGAWVGEVLAGHGSFVTSVATAVVGRRAVAVAAGLTETVPRVWDLGTGRQRPLDGHGGWVRAVATVGFAGRTHAVTGDVDGVVRQWDLRTCTQHGPALTGHAGAVNAVATVLSGGGWPVAVTGGEDRTVRLWDLTTGEQVGREWPFPEPVTAVSVAAAGSVVVGFGFEVAVLDTPVLQRPVQPRPVPDLPVL